MKTTAKPARKAMRVKHPRRLLWSEEPERFKVVVSVTSSANPSVSQSISAVEGPIA
jgi:hypothetical protein